MNLANTQTDLTGRLTRRVMDLSSARRLSASETIPWDVSFSGAVASFSETHYIRGPVTVSPVVADYTVTGSDGYVYLGVLIDTVTGAAQIIEGATFDAVVSREIPTDTYYRIPLYKIAKASSGEGGVSCGVVARYVYGIPPVLAYV